MDADRIIDDLCHFNGSFPRDAVEWAIANREEATPLLLDILEHVADNPHEVMEDDDFMGHLYAMFLLAQFRDVRAYPLIVKYFSRPGEDSLEETGDFVTEDLAPVLASVCGGDIGPIKGLIENFTLNRFIQLAALNALVILVIEEQLPREELVEYLRRLFIETPRTAPAHAWSNFISCAAAIYPGELMPYINACFEAELPDMSYILPEDVDYELRQGLEAVLESRSETSYYRFVTDTVASMSWWACFKQADNRTPTKGPTPKTSSKEQKKRKSKSKSKRKNKRRR